MAEENRYYAYFGICDSFDPADITARVGLNPSKSWRQGDINPKNGWERKFSRWTLRSRLDESKSLEEHIEDVLKQMDANREAFEEISRQYGGVMQLVGYFHTDYPGLHFEPGLVNKLSAYHLAVDHDFYFLYFNDDAGA